MIDRPLQQGEAKWQLVSRPWFWWLFWPAMTVVFLLGIIIFGPINLVRWAMGKPPHEPKTRTPWYSGRK